MEIGCSYGFFLPSLSQISDKVIGTDIEETFNFCFEKTLCTIDQQYQNLELKVADATRLSKTIEPKSCDVIVALSVLEHINDTKKALEEISKCLKGSGLFLCGLSNENWMYKLGRKIIQYSEAHENYSYHNLRQLIDQYFVEEKMINSPWGIPLFKIAIYSPRVSPTC